MTRAEAQQKLHDLETDWQQTAAGHSKAIAPANAKVEAAAAKLAEAKRDRAALLRAREVDRVRYERQRRSLSNALEGELADPRITEAIGRVDRTLRKLQEEHVPSHAPEMLARAERLLAARPRLVSFKTDEPDDIDAEIGKVLADCGA